MADLVDRYRRFRLVEWTRESIRFTLSVEDNDVARTWQLGESGTVEITLQCVPTGVVSFDLLERIIQTVDNRG
jgi:hypothetical protein